jgi:hypothetical protein
MRRCSQLSNLAERLVTLAYSFVSPLMQLKSYHQSALKVLGDLLGKAQEINR